MNKRLTKDQSDHLAREGGEAPLTFELRVTNDARALGTVESFSREILRHTSLADAAADRLHELFVAAMRETFACAYPPGESGAIILSSVQKEGVLEVTIRDFGLPHDFPRLEEALVSTDVGLRKQLLGLDWAHRADEVHYESFSPEGKALRIVKWLHESHVARRGEKLAPFAKAPELAPEQNYEIRRMRPEDAEQISQLIYRAYGSSYFNPDVYYPERVAALNRSGKVVSFVATGSDGRLVGHYALERNQPGPVAEGGQAVVDPAHRGRHLLDRLKEVAIAEAKILGLAGMYADAVTLHTRTQQSNLSHGARPVCADLGIAPATETFKGMAAATQWITCLLYFLGFQESRLRKVFVPMRFREPIERIHEGLQWAVEFGEGVPATEEHGTLTVRYDAGAGMVNFRVSRIGRDTAVALRHGKREFLEGSHADALFIDLPLADPATPSVVDALEGDGFSFAGLAPDFAPEGDLLRLVHLTTPLAREPILTVEPLGAWLIDYALAERARVLAAMGG